MQHRLHIELHTFLPRNMLYNIHTLLINLSCWDIPPQTSSTVTFKAPSARTHHSPLQGTQYGKHTLI